MQRLTDAEVKSALAGLRGWAREGDEIARTFDLGSFVKALAFVNRVGELAERAQHHPDIDIRYAKVRLSLTTHDAGGLTAKDVSLAREIDAIA